MWIPVYLSCSFLKYFPAVHPLSVCLDIRQIASFGLNVSTLVSNTNTSMSTEGEIAAAVPDFTWLSGILYLSDGPLQVRVTGRAGSIFAITQFMRRLEASRFLRAVQTETIQEVLSEASPGDLVFMFELTLTYVGPPLDELQTIPLFGDAASQAQIADQGN